ncbi:MAG: DMP19 family protein [Gammaproteobacteria bacterium]|nr:DMP19 family protein [Gammaproteobacteria bacterium]
MDISQILEEQDDETLIMNVVAYITAKQDFDIDSIPDVEKNVVAVITAQTIIDNRGFKYFFESDFSSKPDYQLFVDAYRSIGAEDSAEGIMQALALFPDNTPPADVEERYKYLEAIFDTEDHRYQQISQHERKIAGNLQNYSKAAAYIRQNKHAFV